MNKTISILLISVCMSILTGEIYTIQTNGANHIKTLIYSIFWYITIPVWLSRVLYRGVIVLAGDIRWYFHGMRFNEDLRQIKKDWFKWAP